MSVFITGLAVLGPAGSDADELYGSLARGRRALSPLSLFATHGDAPRPVAALLDFSHEADLPRTHALARAAAAQLSGMAPPDAVVLGGTTGGMPLSEVLLLEGARDPARFSLHGTGTVAQDLARQLGCTGPALTVSTACSSGAVALKVGLELIRRGLCNSVLAGGVDALCRLTYHGFRLLKLIDPEGARPLDAGRRGMSVGEAAALLLLQGSPGDAPAGALAELRGVGASCDAHHATMPLPGGEGALSAMERALADAGLTPGDVDYINLHGTGTAGNDASEAAAVRALYGQGPVPALSSTKGITGHPLAAAGALEAAACTLCLDRGLLPGNVGLDELDASLGITPLRESREQASGTMLSNSFGFGGNNASVVLTRPDHHPPAPAPSLNRDADMTLQVLGACCLSAAGGTRETLAALDTSTSTGGQIPDATLKQGLPPRLIRRLKRLPRMALSLADALLDGRAEELTPRSIYFGTAWGPLSETHDFLVELFASDEDLSSPTDFVGSVHNAPAGQLAMRYKARGMNLTATGGHGSFGQALLMAALTATPDDEPLLLLGADEFHPRFSPMLDPEAAPRESEGGGALLLRRPPHAPAGEESIWIRPLHLDLRSASPSKFLAGLPSPAVVMVCGEQARRQAEALSPGSAAQILDYSVSLGLHASAPAQAAALAVEMIQQGRVRAVVLPTPGDPNASAVIWRGACP